MTIKLSLPFIGALLLGIAVLAMCWQISCMIARLGGKPPNAIERWVVTGIGLMMILLLGRHEWMPPIIRLSTGLLLILMQSALPFDSDVPLYRSRWSGDDPWGRGGDPFRRARAGVEAPPGVISLDTHLLVMTQAADGALSGRVSNGRFRGRVLDDLPIEHLMQLWTELRLNDPMGVPLLEAWLERSRFRNIWRDKIPGSGGQIPPWERQRAEWGPEMRNRSSFQGDPWGPGRTRNSGGGASGIKTQLGGAMNRDTALGLLGLPGNAAANDIKSAHRRLMLKMHPDKGGSTEAATQLNLAKDFLLQNMG